MSLLKLASLQSVASFCRSADAINSFVVVLPFEPPTATTGKLKSRRYAAANFPSAARASSTTSTRTFRQWRGDFSSFHDHRRDAFGRDFLQKFVAVEAFAFDGKKQVAGLRLRESVHTR